MTSWIVTLGTTQGPSRGVSRCPRKRGPTPLLKLQSCTTPKRKVEVVSYNMERFTKDCVSVFCEFSGYPKAKVGTAPTPFLDESKDPLAIFEEPATTGTKGQYRRPRSPVPSQEGQAPDMGERIW